MDVKKYCKVCDVEIHPKRVALGYRDTCVNHSLTEKYTGHITETCSETYEVVVIKNPETAKELRRLSSITTHG